MSSIPGIVSVIVAMSLACSPRRAPETPPAAYREAVTAFYVGLSAMQTTQEIWRVRNSIASSSSCRRNRPGGPTRPAPPAATRARSRRGAACARGRARVRQRRDSETPGASRKPPREASRSDRALAARADVGSTGSRGSLRARARDRASGRREQRRRSAACARAARGPGRQPGGAHRVHADRRKARRCRGIEDGDGPAGSHLGELAARGTGTFQGTENCRRQPAGRRRAGRRS